MSSLIASQDSDVITLIDGTEIEINTNMYNNPSGFIVTESTQPDPNVRQICMLISVDELETIRRLLEIRAMGVPSGNENKTVLDCVLEKILNSSSVD